MVVSLDDWVIFELMQGRGIVLEMQAFGLP